jgi:hypothetical protein
LIKQTCITVFKNQLHWKIANIYQWKPFGKTALLEDIVKPMFDKKQTVSDEKKAINDHLYKKLPFPKFSDGDRVVKTEILFDYFKTRYANFGRVA